MKLLLSSILQVAIGKRARKVIDYWYPTTVARKNLITFMLSNY
jgi:hypothetical protein